MKRILITLTLFFSVIAASFAQAPQKFSYQAVVRNESNTLVRGTVGVRVSILQGGVNGTVVYQETHTTTTNINGLMTLQIGGGTMLSGDFATIDWADGPYFLKTETDPNGGTNYTIEGTQQLLSVPYALYAGSAANSFSGCYNDLTDLPQIPDIPTNVSAFNNDAGYITMDSVPEIPTNVSAFVNDAGYVTESTLTNENYITQNDLITNNYVTSADIPTNVSAFTNDAGYITMDSIPEIPTVPTNVSAFVNDAGYITSADVPTIPTNVSAFTNDAGYVTESTLTTENYITQNDLITNNYVTSADIPTNVSAFTNDAGYITATQVPAQVNADWNATAGVAQILNKPTIPNVPVNVSAFTNDAHYITEFQLQEILNTITTMQNTINSMNQVIEDLNNQVNPPIPTLGTVITLPVESITPSTAVAGGNVTSNGHQEITARGVCWSTTNPPTIADSHTTDSTGLGTFTSIVSGLALSTTYYLCAYVTNEMGTAYGEVVTFTTTTASSFTCGTPTLTDIDGNTYNTVQIGTQCWMKENLRTTKYADGTSISHDSTTSYDTPYWYYPNNDSSNKPTYGLLYNWKAVMHDEVTSSANPSGVQGICPDGWHVPSDAEWTQLTDYVSSQNQYVCGSNNTYIAKALAGTTDWISSATTCAVGNTPSDNNASGFSVLPAGEFFGSYNNFATRADYWSSTERDDDYAYRRYFFYSNANVSRTYVLKHGGYSVRCVCDESQGGSIETTIPTVTTAAVSDVTSTTAVCGGNVISDGGATVTVRGVCWSTSHNPTTSNSNTTNGTGAGSFTSSLTGLTSNTTYYVRAYATNSVGEAYGEEQSFSTTTTTLPTPTVSVERNGNNFYFTIQTPGVSGVTYCIKTYKGNSYTCSNTSDPTTSSSGPTGEGANSTATCSVGLSYPVLIFKVIGKKSGYNSSAVSCYTGYWE